MTNVAKTKKVPRLRFQEFNDGWEEKKLDDVAELTSSKRVYLSDYVKIGVPFYRGKEITELRQGKKPKDILFISNEAYESFKKRFGVPGKDDILITAVGTLGNVMRVKDSESFYFKDGNLIWLRNIKQDPLFTEILLEKNRHKLLKSAIGSSQQALTIIGLKKVKLNFPDKDEQEKIAGFLAVVDNKISALRKKKELLEKYKKGMMQKIFPPAGGRAPQIRFKDKNRKDYPDWEEKTFDEVFERVTRKNKENNLNVLTISAQQGLLNQEKFFNKSVAAKNLTGYYLLEKGDFAYNKSYSKGYPMGAIKKLNNYNKGVVSTLYICFKIKGSDSEDFFEQYFNAGLQNKEIEKIAQEGARNHGLLNISVIDFFESVILKAPTPEEQQKIADFLIALDDKIKLTERELEQAKKFKKALLQQMFV